MIVQSIKSIALGYICYMSLDLVIADFGFAPVLVFIIWIIRAIIKANKKAEQKNNTPGQKPQRQPGKTIEDILRELEQRASGRAPEEKEAPQNTPPPTPPVVKEIVKKHEKTVEEYKQESHSDMYKHHMTEAKLHDGKFDEIDDRLLHLENFEAEEHESLASSLLNTEDMRKAIILNSILQRPDF